MKPVLKQMFGKASREAAREALPRAVPNGAKDEVTPENTVPPWSRQMLVSPSTRLHHFCRERAEKEK